jgi:hypothetical protein
MRDQLWSAGIRPTLDIRIAQRLVIHYTRGKALLPFTLTSRALHEGRGKDIESIKRRDRARVSLAPAPLVSEGRGK